MSSNTRWGLILGCCLLWWSSGLAQVASPRAYYRAIKRENGVKNTKIPGWLIWVGTGLAYSGTRNAEWRAVLPLGKRLGTLRRLAVEPGAAIAPAQVAAYASSLPTAGYEVFFSLKTPSEQWQC